MLNEIEKNCLKQQIPIVERTTIEFIVTVIKENKVQEILEIGTGGGYSAIKMALANSKINILTIEKDQARYQLALDNINKMKLEKQITVLNQDAMTFTKDTKYDLIFIDAAKASNKTFFEKFQQDLTERGIIIIDNLNLRGITEDNANRNLRSLARKNKTFKKYLQELSDFETVFVDVGDGIAIARKR